MKRARSHKVRLDLHPVVSGYINALLAVGLFGVSREDVVERLLCEKLRELERQGWCGTNHDRKLRPRKG
jgi:hypothetical protein